MWKKLKGYIELIKPFNGSKSTLYYGFCTFIGTLLASSYDIPIKESLLAALSVTLSAFAIYALNDIYDIEIDRINAPERPLPSGLITIREAKIITILLFISSLSIAYTIKISTFLLIFFFAILGIIYSTPPIRLKDGIFGTICWGLGIATTIICGSSVTVVTPRPLIAAMGLFILTSGCGFTKDLKDREGDKAMKIRTIPIILGEKRAIFLMTIMAMVGFHLFLIDFIYYGIDFFYLIIIIASMLIFIYSLIQLHKNPGSNFIYKKVYKTQGISGLLINIAFLFIALF
jgi:geranylgeranylglycerol-phosphate geranylgeranyltransferase